MTRPIGEQSETRSVAMLWCGTDWVSRVSMTRVYRAKNSIWSHQSQGLCAMSIGPPILRYSYFKIWSRSCVRSKMKVMFDLQNSKVKVKVKVKHIGHIWILEFNRYVCFLFRGNRTTFGWDIGNSIFDLENSRSRSWPRSNLMVTFEALSSIDMFAFRFAAIGPFLAEI